MAQQVVAFQTAFTGKRLAVNASAPRNARRAAFTVAAIAEPKAGKESRIGKMPLKIPKNVQVTLNGQNVKVKGPKGNLEWTFPPLVEIKQTDPETICCYRMEDSRKANEVHGLTRSLINNMIIGTSDGYTKTLTMIGVGFRATCDNKTLQLTVGYADPVTLEIPKGISCKVDKQTTIILEGFDKVALGDFAAKVRAKKPPEPYKGKGIRYADEVIKLKEGKRGK